MHLLLNSGERVTRDSLSNKASLNHVAHLYATQVKFGGILCTFMRSAGKILKQALCCIAALLTFQFLSVKPCK